MTHLPAEGAAAEVEAAGEVAREQRALDADRVPARDLVRAGERAGRAARDRRQPGRA